MQEVTHFTIVSAYLRSNHYTAFGYGLRGLLQVSASNNEGNKSKLGLKNHSLEFGHMTLEYFMNPIWRG